MNAVRFRAALGGIHKLLKYPDIVVYGKAIGNGYAITTVLGKKIMIVRKTFISSTFWSERSQIRQQLQTLEIIKNKIL